MLILDYGKKEVCEMTVKVNIHEARTHFSKLLTQVVNGEEIIIAKDSKLIALLVPATERPKQRIPGSAEGKVKIDPDFDAPLPE